MKFVSTSKSALTRANMAYLFLERMAKEHRLNEISNIDEVLEALNPVNVIDGFLEYAKNKEESI